MPLKVINGFPQFVSPYDKSIYYSAGLVSGSNITLPEGEEYKKDDASDLFIIFNEKIVENIRDFVVPAGATKTYITTEYNLPADTVVRFKKI